MTWAGTAAPLRRFWPAIPILALGLWAARLDHLRAGYASDLAKCQSGRALDRANGETAAAKAENGWLRQQIDAGKAQADREAARAPLIIRSTDTVREYAKTDAGRVLCRGADRVRAIDDLDAALAEDPRPAGSGTRAVPSDAAAPPAGR